MIDDKELEELTELEVIDESKTSDSSAIVPNQNVIEVGDYKFVELYNDPKCVLCSLDPDQRQLAAALYVEVNFNPVEFAKRYPFSTISPEQANIHFKHHYRPVPKVITSELATWQKIELPDLLGLSEPRLDLMWLATINTLISDISMLKAQRDSEVALTGEFDLRLERLITSKEKILSGFLTDLGKIQSFASKGLDSAISYMVTTFREQMMKVLKSFVEEELKRIPTQNRPQVAKIIEKFWDEVVRTLDISVEKARAYLKTMMMRAI